MSAKLIEKLKAKFGAKVVDEAMAEEKEGKAKDESKPAKKDEPAKVDAKDEEAVSLDSVMKAVKDLSDKVSAMKPGKDASTKATENEPAKVDAEDEGEEAPAAEGEKSLEDRLKALEVAVAKLLEREAKEDEVPVDEEEMGEESEDEESEDDDFEESTMTGDTKSRVEILAPGLKAKAKDAKVEALKAAYATKDGKAVIHTFTGGKAPDLKDESKVNTLFVAASELLKHTRASELASTKSRSFDSTAAASKGAMSAEQLNEINAKHYANR